MNTKETSLPEVQLVQQFKKPIDYLVFQLKQQYYHLSDNELKLLALICLKGVNKTIKDVAVREGVFKSKQTVANALSKFRTQGILDRDDEPVLQANIITEKKGRLVIDISL
jgi:hypothetical protein